MATARTTTRLRIPGRRSSRFAGLLVVAALAMSTTACGTKLPLVGDQTRGPVAGLTEKVDTIRVCAETLGDIRGASAVAARAGLPPSTTAARAAARAEIAVLLQKLRHRAARHRNLAISGSIDRLATALARLDASLSGSESVRLAAAAQVSKASESVVTHCASVGA